MTDYSMILARPGFNEKYNKEVDWDELKRTFMLYKRIPMIVAGGSHSGLIDPNDAIGHVDAKIDEATQTIRGLPVFYKERFEDVPADIQQKLATKGKVHASLGYTPFKDIRKIDHILIGAERPVFKDIGFNAEDDSFRYEETEGIGKDEEKAPEQEPKDTQNVIQMTEEQFNKLIATLTPKEQVKEPEPVVEEKVPEQDIQEETVEADPPPPPVEPERTFSRATSDVADDIFDVEGGSVISLPLGGTKKKES